MSVFWYHERTESGWDIRDENRDLVAVVPDAKHKREHDAKQIVASGPPISATPLAESKLEDEIAALRGLVRDLALAIEADANVLVLRVKTHGPDAVSSDDVAGHVQELVTVEAALTAKRLRLHELRRAKDGAA